MGLLQAVVSISVTVRDYVCVTYDKMPSVKYTDIHRSQAFGPASIEIPLGTYLVL